MRPGDVVNCYAAVQEDGVTRQTAPSGFPSAADPCIVKILQETATDCGVTPIYGITLSSALYYMQRASEPSCQELARHANVEVCDMEIAALFFVARLRNVRAGAICCVDAPTRRVSEAEAHRTAVKVTAGKKNTMQIAIATAARITKEKSYEWKMGESRHHPATRTCHSCVVGGSPKPSE